MANETRRYKSATPLDDPLVLQQRVAGVVDVTLGKHPRYADVVVDEEAGDDLDDYMLSRGWVFVALQPTSALPITDPADPVEVTITGGQWTTVWQHDLVESEGFCVAYKANVAHGNAAAFTPGRVQVKGSGGRQVGQGSGDVEFTPGVDSTIAGLDIRLEAEGNAISVQLTTTNNTTLTVWPSVLECDCHMVPA